MSVYKPRESIGGVYREIPGVLDRNAWHEVFLSEVASHRPDQNLSVLFMDVNDFKDINDKLGHLKGDMVIEEVRGLVDHLVDNLRTTNSPKGAERNQDLVSIRKRQPEVASGAGSIGGHIGGDEFAILVHTDEQGATIVANRLREEFNDYLAQDQNSALREIGIGLAIGTSTLKPGMTSSDFLSEADKAMYKDKERQLPILNTHQETLLRIASLSLQGADIRVQDFAKYLRRHSESDS